MFVADVAAGHVEAEDEIALVEERRLRAVEVFGYAVRVERARAEAHDAAVEIADGDHQAAAEAVVAGVAFLVLGQQPDGHQLVLAVALAGEVGAGCVP